MPELGFKAQEKLGKSSVLVVGAGGLGSPVIAYLAAAGEPVKVGGETRPLGPAEVAAMEEYLAVYGREQ